ncbi:MAG TPA: hypothetical protein VG317_04430 [Pseudonocardiaceae bacterium]|jgi:hypothetical protein|nr:hypothetical protein [Pseudonocardiaceae bacterium]
MGRTIQIREVDDQAHAVLRARAEAENLSLTAYLRRELERMANRPTMAELLERADRRRAEGISVNRDDILAAVRAAREEGD